MSNDFIAKKRLEEQRQSKLGVIPEKYILLIKTPVKAYVVEGRKDFTEYHSRQSTMTAWFEFMLGLTKILAMDNLNRRFRVSYFPPSIKSSEQLYGMTIQHIQDGTVCFGGRLLSRCAVDNRETTTELIAFFDELNEMCDEEVRAHLQEFCFAIHDL